MNSDRKTRSSIPSPEYTNLYNAIRAFRTNDLMINYRFINLIGPT